jgi:hypothetical protein
MRNLSLASDDLRCSFMSLSTGEQLYATAPRTDFWVLIEYPSAYGAKALEESTLPDIVKSYLNANQKAIPHARILLIRKADSISENNKRIYFCASGRSSPCIYTHTLSDYDELLTVDFEQIFHGKADSNYDLSRKPMFLVCTNGKRDPCCAQWGIPVFTSAAEHYGENIWQCSHVGGHRFAANLICLPHGIYNGRLRPESIGEVLEDYQNGYLNLEHYRGRSSYPPQAQAAEYYLMRETSKLDIDAYRFENLQAVKAAEWDVRFTSNIDGLHYSVRLAAVHSERAIFESCSSPDQRVTHPQYRLEGWSKL